MPTPRSGAVAVPVSSGIYVIGGLDSSGAVQPANEYYDLASGTWTKKSPGPARSEAAATYICSTPCARPSIYFLGGRDAGQNYSSAVDIYAIDTDTWTTGIPMPEGRLAFGVITDNSGIIYAVGGVIGPPTTVVSLNESFDPSKIKYLYEKTSP